MDRTFIICKPDAVERGLIGEILGRFERRNLSIVAAELRTIDRGTAEKHPFFGELVDFIVSSPLVAIALEGPNAVAICRAINGATRPHEAAPGSIRGDFALDTGKNLVHASDSVENAQAELALWFTAGEIHGWERSTDRWILPV